MSIVRTLEQLCAAHIPAAVNYLASVLTDPDAGAKDRLIAARELLDRGAGRPVDRQIVAMLETGASGGAATLTNEQLAAIAAGAVAGLMESAHDSQVIDLQAERISRLQNEPVQE